MSKIKYPFWDEQQLQTIVAEWSKQGLDICEVSVGAPKELKDGENLTTYTADQVNSVTIPPDKLCVVTISYPEVQAEAAAWEQELVDTGALLLSSISGAGPGGLMDEYLRH